MTPGDTKRNKMQAVPFETNGMLGKHKTDIGKKNDRTQSNTTRNSIWAVGGQTSSLVPNGFGAGDIRQTLMEKKKEAFELK